MLLVVTALMAGPAHTQQTSPKTDSYHRCVEDMVLWTLRRANGPIDRNKVAAQILSSCPAFPKLEREPPASLG